MTEAQATDLIAKVALLQETLNYHLPGCFWILCWILATMLWRNFILAKNQRNFLAIALALSLGSSASAQNYQLSGVVFESSMIFAYDVDNDPTSIQHFWEMTCGGPESVTYFIGWTEAAPTGETYQCMDRSGVMQDRVVPDEPPEIVVVDGQDVNFTRVATLQAESPQTDLARMISPTWPLPADTQKVTDRRWIMIRFPSAGLDINVSSSAIDDLPSAPYEDPESPHYGENPDEWEPEPVEGAATMEGFTAAMSTPDWGYAGAPLPQVVIPTGAFSGWGLNFSHLFAGFSSVVFVDGELVDPVYGYALTSFDNAASVVRAGLLIGVVIWFVASVVTTLRQW